MPLVLEEYQTNTAPLALDPFFPWTISFSFLHFSSSLLLPCTKLYPKTTGQGLSGSPEEGSLKEFGDGGSRPRVVQRGSPEHNLLTEAKVVCSGGDCMSEKEEEGIRPGRSPRWKGFNYPEGRGAHRARGTDLRESQLESRKEQNPSSQVR